VVKEALIITELKEEVLKEQIVIISASLTTFWRAYLSLFGFVRVFLGIGMRPENSGGSLWGLIVVIFLLLRITEFIRCVC
jgi:hypothetical protein